MADARDDSEFHQGSVVAYMRVGKATAILGKPVVKTLVVSVWLGLSVAGLLFVKPFLGALQTSIPPVHGTQSYTAYQQFLQFFPEKTAEAALLIDSSDGGNLVDFQKKSTAHCIIDPDISLPNINGTFSCKRFNEHGVGGGCETKEHLIEYFSSLLGPFGPAAKALLEDLTTSLPNITECPVADGQTTDDFLEYMTNTIQALTAAYPQCKITGRSFNSLPPIGMHYNKKLDFNGTELDLNLGADIPGGELWQLLESQLLANGGSTSIMGVSVTGCDVVQLDSKNAVEFATFMNTLASKAPSSLRVRASSQKLMMESIQEGINQTMDLSTLTMPIALAILGAMIRNVRLGQH
eukprot:TRINITY_DN34100_c0_g1_i7.p1 TRINITY_DN34100_c0_g1~~TRINITY_DN34100_c0_g1_i7.p1  ORF type:complete len:351 (+),score=53.05 TRINITY_DN34100_c0_g1_i7:70-1122(+)